MTPPPQTSAFPPCAVAIAVLPLITESEMTDPTPVAPE